MTLAALLFCVLLIALVAFQVALIAGAPIGHLAWGGQDRVLPKSKRVGSASSIVIYALIGWVALARIGAVWPGETTFIIVAMWVITAYLALGIVLNAISRSTPERLVMMPTATVLAVLALLIALS
jgi:hypothetical protein